MSIAEVLKNLIKIQSIDKDIYDLKRELGDIPVKLKALDDEMGEISAKAKAREEEFKQFQLKRKEKEMDLEQKETSIKKLQSQLYQVKTNKEYTALEHEIAGFNADKSDLEDDILVMFDDMEAAEKALQEARKDLEDEKEKVEVEKKKVDDEKKEIGKGLSELDAKRKAITPSIDKVTLSKYERILKNKDGMALVPVVGENCGGCFVDLPPQVISEIRLRENIMYCERCARMLYTED